MNHQQEINIIFPESTKKYVALQANSDTIIYRQPPYLKVVEEWVQALNPAVCLELGAGIGRMSVYFRKKFGWKDTFYYLQDGNSGDVQYGGIRDHNENEFYNSFTATREFCEANGVENFETVQSLTQISKQVDFCYSFAAIGFHWHIDLYLDQLPSVLAPGAHLLFELKAPIAESDKAGQERRDEYQRFFDNQVSYARSHSAYKVLDVVNLDNYSGYRYKDRTYFLIMQSKK
jgi:hypothetical protein